MDKFKKIIDNLNPTEKRVIELAGQADKLEEMKRSITDEKELKKVQKEIDDLNKERIELIEASNKKESGVNVNVDSIEGTKYSIPEMDGTFSEASKNSDSNYYKVDKHGNVYILTDASVKRMINRSDSYLKPVFDFAAPKESDNGIGILELPKIDPSTGALIKKGSLIFTETEGLAYSSVSLEGVEITNPGNKTNNELGDKEKISDETDEQKAERIRGEIKNLQNPNEKSSGEIENDNKLNIIWDKKGKEGTCMVNNNEIVIKKRGWFKKGWEVKDGLVTKEFDTEEEAIGELKKIYNEYITELEEEILGDRKNKSLSYLALEKSNNQILINTLTNKDVKKIDLRGIVDSQEITWKYLHPVDKNEGYFEWNIFGFIKVIKNVEEISGEKGIDSYSEKAIYKIIGPNNEIIADNIQGYGEATRIYNEETNKQKVLIEQEFEKMLSEENSQTSQEDDNKPEDENMETNKEENIEENEGNNTEEQQNEETIKNEEGDKPEEITTVIEIPALENVLANKELEMNNRLEKSKWSKSIIKSLDKWEKFGQGEEGKKGFAKRMTKNAINLALIGLISSLSVEKLAEAGYGTATALGGGTFTYVGRKMAIGLGFATAFDRVGNKFSDNKNYGKIKKVLPWMVGIGSVTAATLMSGGMVGVATGAGFLASKLYKSRYTNEKIAAREAKAKNEFFEKYKNQELNIDQLKKIEKDYESLLKHYQRTRIWGKLADSAAKLSIGTIISTTTLEVSGMAKDAVASIHNQNEHPDTHIKPIEEETTTKTPDDLNKNIIPPHQADTTKLQSDTLNSSNENISAPDSTHSDTTTTTEQPTTTSPETHTEMKDISVDFSSRGAIATIDDLKDQIRHEYPDISKAPENIREFMETDSTKMAIKLGFYDPDSPNESAMVIKGSTLSLGQEQGLVMHDIRTGEDHTFLEGAHDDTIDKYDGKMFDSDHSAHKIEEASTTTDVNESGHHGEGVTGTDDNSHHINETTDKTETTNHEQATDNKEVTTNKESTGEHSVDKQESSVIDHRVLTNEELEQVKNTYNHNLDKLMDSSPESRWEYIQKNVTAERFMELADKGEIKSDFHSLADHMKKLEEVTGVRPEGAQYIGGLLVREAESIPNYIGRALEEALRKGVLDKVTL